MNQSIAFIVHLPGKPERRAELESKLLYVLDQMSKEPDFINTYLHRSIEDPDTLVLYESWACSEQHIKDHHLKASYRREYEAVLDDLLKAPRTLEFLTPVREYQKAGN